MTDHTQAERAAPVDEIVQDVADVFRGAGFEVREELGTAHPFAVAGSLDSAAILLETMVTNRASSAADTGVDRLPPPAFTQNVMGGDDMHYYTAEQVRQAQREAVDADRMKRKAEAMKIVEHSRAVSEDAGNLVVRISELEAEIAQLRAELASRGATQVGKP